MKKRIFALLLALVMTVGIFATEGFAANENPFSDVNKYSYYYDAVMWAYENGVTTGTSATEFSPREHCTRGQVVTFLWRAAGKPEPSSSRNPFTDVKTSDYFYKPVLWAVEKGITTGTSTTEFSPEQTCLESQVITFIWRAAGKPAASATGTKAETYNDSDYYKTAVAWADRKGMLDNYSKFYKDSRSCRCDIVYYMYRSEEKTAATRTVPDLMAYLGVSRFEYNRYDNFYVCSAKFETISDYNFSLMTDFMSLIDKHGFDLKLADKRTSHDDNGDYLYYYYEYVGPEADKVSPTSAGTNYNFSLIFLNTKGYDDPNFNCCEIRVCVGNGLTQADTGERTSRKLTAFTPVETTPTPTPTPTQTPTQTPTTPAAPTTNTGRPMCETCNGYGKLTCGYCYGTGRVSINWGPSEDCPRCNGDGVYTKCKDCGGDGYLDPGDPKYVPPKVLGKCKYCKGTGNMKCSWCNGTGTRSHYNEQTKHVEQVPCPACWGDRSIPCPACGADGWVDEEDPG